MTPVAMRFFDQFRGRIDLYPGGDNVIAIASSETKELGRISVSRKDAEELSKMPPQSYPVGYHDVQSFVRAIDSLDHSHWERFRAELSTLLGEDRMETLNRAGGHVGVMRRNMTPAQQTAEHAYCLLLSKCDELGLLD